MPSSDHHVSAGMGIDSQSVAVNPTIVLQGKRLMLDPDSVGGPPPPSLPPNKNGTLFSEGGGPHPKRSMVFRFF